MDPQRKRRDRRLFFWLCIALLVGFAVTYEGRNLIACYIAQHSFADGENLSIVPTPPPNTGTATLTGLRVKTFSFSFQVPWQKIDNRRKFKALDTMSFKDGASVMIFNPSTEVDTLAILKGKNGDDRALLQNLLGPASAQSNYGLLSTALATVPAQSKWWKPLSNNVRIMTLLGIKSMDMHRCRSIHPIAANSLRGFQFDDPDAEVVHLVLFDQRDRKYEITLAHKGSLAAVLTQSQINAIVESVHPLPTAPPPAGSNASPQLSSLR